MKKEKLFRGFSEKGFLFVCVVSLILIATNAAADFSFNLIYANSGLNNGATDDYAKVTVALTDPDNATITFDAIGDYLLKNQLGVQVNSSNFTASPTNFVGNQTMDGWGSYNASYKGIGTLSSFSFSIDNHDSGIDWATATDVLVLNDINGYYAAAHIQPPNSGSTGFAAGNGGPGTTVPLPAAVWLFGTGLLGLVGLRKRLNK